MVVNKKLVIIPASLILLIILVLIYIFKDQLSRFLGLSSSFNQASQQEEKPEYNFEWIWWEDAAGFAFEYPQSFEINDHPEDEINYANLELTSQEKSGRIIILVNDTEYADIEAWLENDELVKEGSGLGTEVASMSANKVVLKEGREVAGFIDWDQVIYTVDVEGEDKDYWQAVYDQILTSFKLIPLEGESQETFTDWMGGFDTSGVDIVEAMEVIE